MSGPPLSDSTMQHLVELERAHRQRDAMKRAFDAGDFKKAREIAEDACEDLDASIRGLIGYSRCADYEGR